MNTDNMDYLDNKYFRIMPPIILVITVLLFSLFICLPDSEYSENENRYLEKFPEVTSKSVFSGKWMADFEDYTSDQFPFRDAFVGIKNKFETLTFHTKINGIYKARDGFFIEPYEKPKKTDMIIRRINRLSDTTDTDIGLMLVPTAVTIYDDKLPKFAQTYSQTTTLDKIYSSVKCDTIDVLSHLKKNSDNNELFYKLDHHWTLKGAYYGYEAFCEWAELECKPFDSFDYKEITDKFKGTVFSKINDSSLDGDTMWNISLPDSDLTIQYPDGTTSSTLFVDKYLNEKDMYSYYLGNDSNDLITITNKKAKTKETLIVIKDSYANSFIPYICDYYETIYIINPRYFRNTKISDFINTTKADKVLILYNLNTLDTDEGIRALF